MARARVTQDEDTGARWYPYPTDPDLLLTSVTTITGGTQNKPWLSGWQSGMAARFTVGHIALIEAVAAGLATVVATRETGRDAAVSLITDTSERLRDVKKRAGTFVHDVLEMLIKWGQLPGHRGDLVGYPEIPADLAEALYDGEPLADVVAAMTDGFTQFVCDWNPTFLYSEMTVYHVQMGVAGTLDIICVIEDAALVRQGEYLALVRRKGSRVVLCLDAKTGKILDAPMEEQVCTYPRMTEANVGLGQLAPMPHTDAAGILHLRHTFKSGYRVRVIPPERATAAWNRFGRAATIFMEREQIKVVGDPVHAPTGIEGEFPPVPVDACDGDPRYPRAPKALMKAGFETLADVAVFTADDLVGVKGKGGDKGVPGIGDATLPVIRKMLGDRDLYLAGESPDEQARAVMGVAA